MAKQNQLLGNSSTPIWARRIANLLRERKMTQLQLAQMSGVSTASISEWLNSRDPREPKITGFKDVADALGVSTDYLLGANECTTPTNEEIHSMTGLSDKAIKKLRKLQRDIEKNDRSAAEKLAACNYLLERMNSTSFFECLYGYLLAELYFKKGDFELGANTIYSKAPDGSIFEALTIAEGYSHAYLAMIVQELSLMKDTADKAKLPKKKADYIAWEKTDDGEEIELETLKMQAAYEDGEEPL